MQPPFTTLYYLWLVLFSTPHKTQNLRTILVINNDAAVFHAARHDADGFLLRREEVVATAGRLLLHAASAAQCHRDFAASPV